jgi:hypothetical protein
VLFNPGRVVAGLLTPAVYGRFAREKIQITFPHRDVRVLSEGYPPPTVGNFSDSCYKSAYRLEPGRMEMKERALERGGRERIKASRLCRAALVAVAGLVALAGLALAGCSADDERPGTDGSVGGYAASGGGSQQNMDGGGSGSSANGLADFDACAGELHRAEGQALDIYIILDHTGSMGNDCPLDLSGAPPPDTSKWCYATHALARYFMSDSATGHRAALQFMSLEDGVCTGGLDNGEAHARVELTWLPVSATDALITTLDTDDPVGGLGTQIEAALHGIATYTSNNITPGRTMIGILITDGDPNGCDENIDNLAGIIADHLAATGIRTFIIGMTGATLDNLETMAAAGGAPAHGPDFCGPGVDSCHYWSVGDGDPQAFVDALQQIQAAAILPCVYSIPDAPPGEQLDPGLVNMTFADPTGAQQIIYGVESADQCRPDTGGWYYEPAPPATPSSIRLCPASCDLVTTAGTGSNVNIAYGCSTQYGPII